MSQSLPIVLMALGGCCGCYAPDTTIARAPAHDGGVDIAEADAPYVCPQTVGGPYMVMIGDFCIDTTEVTKAQYKAWLDGDPVATPATQVKECASNTTFRPQLFEGEPRRCTGDVIDLRNNVDDPVVCIDWCDASAYCRAHGKRLCGRIGGGRDEDLGATGGLRDPKVNQWMAACVGGPPTKFPYGDEYQKATCNGKEYGLGEALPVAAKGSVCHGKGPPPFGAIWDMSGNVAEWTDACQIGPTAPAKQECQTRGGAFPQLQESLACASLDLRAARDYFDDHIGFRCCSP